jgi:prephenate dehydratase
MRRGDPTRAAIAGRRAAEIYGASIIRESIQDQPENFTRFVLLSVKGNES